MPEYEKNPSKREFELSLKKAAGGWAGKTSPEEEEELKKLREKNAMKRRASALGGTSAG